MVKSRLVGSYPGQGQSYSQGNESLFSPAMELDYLFANLAGIPQKSIDESGINAGARERLRRLLGSAALAECERLLRETDPQFYFSGLLSLSDRLEVSGRLSSALVILRVIAERAPLAAVARTAQRRIDAAQGTGTLGERVEFLVQRLPRQAADPAAIFAMGTAGMIYRGVRVAALGRLLSNPGARTWTRGLGARAVAASIAFGAETVGFTAAHRLGSAAMGREQDWAASSLGREYASGAISLFALKGMGALSRLGLRQAAGLRGFSGGLASHLLPQAGMFLGILAGHRLEAAAGLREKAGGVSELSEALSLLFQFQVSARLAQHAFGPKWRSMERGLEFNAARLAEAAPSGRTADSVSLMPAAIEGLAPPLWMAMAAEGGDRGRVKGGGVLVGGGKAGATARDFAAMEGLETTRLKTGELARITASELERIRNRYERVAGQIDSKARKTYELEFENLETRCEFWRREMERAAGFPQYARHHYLRDIEIGQRRLLDRVLRFAAAVFSEPLRLDGVEGFGLRKSFSIPTPESPSDASPPPEAQPAGKPAVRVVSALKNRDVGFGVALSLRAHQTEALRRIQAWLASQQENVESGAKLPEEMLQATVVMPVGGGKTRVLVASFAAVIERGLFLAERGDKLLLLNHTDQIHGQNIEVLEKMSPYFRRRFGRPLRISQYKAETKDVSGDVVVVSVPTVSQVESRDRFAAELQNALGAKGRIAMTAVDEVHHLEMGRGQGQETWAQLLEALRQVSPNFFRIGFTATPTGREGKVLFRLREYDLMRSGVTPRTYLVRVEGEDLSHLKLSRDSADFSLKTLSSVLLGFPDRNRRLFEALDAHGLRRPEPSPGGGARPEPTLGFASDLEHALMMAKDYCRYFLKISRSKSDLGGRRLLVLGESAGKVSSSDLEAALLQYRRGEIDGIVAIVSGQTRTRGKILEAVERGEVEAVFTVDALVEGADLHMFRHQLGARPTFSRIKRGQERGRINRRGPGEVGPGGVLIHDPPRILFDVIDRFQSFERALIRYGDLLGAPLPAPGPFGDLIDMVSGQVVPRADRDGSKSWGARRDVEGEPGLSGRRYGEFYPNSTFRPLVDLLRKVLARQYGGSLELLAEDLGETSGYVGDLLEGRGWKNHQWFLRRLGTLLYQERDSFLIPLNETRRGAEAVVDSADLEMVRGALRVYEGWEGSTALDQGLRIRGNLGWGDFEVKTGANAIRMLDLGLLGDRSWRLLWRGLACYFELRARQESFNPERRHEARLIADSLRDHFFRREAWPTETDGKEAELLFRARATAALRFGWVLPKEIGIEGIPLQTENGGLRAWLGSGDIKIGKNLPAREFYSQIRVLMRSGGMPEAELESAIEAMVFERRAWPTRASSSGEALLLEARRLVARRFGGFLPNDHGIDGIPKQNSFNLLSQWLEGKVGRLPGNQSSKGFYFQVRALLEGLGMPSSRADRLISEDVFERNGWPLNADTAAERLRLATRKYVALNLGGVIPEETGLPGVPTQVKMSTLTRWLQGEAIEFNNGKSTPYRLYSQVRALLQGLGAPTKEVDVWIRDTVFEERGWSLENGTAQGRLLNAARELVALRLGGVLSTQAELSGVSPDIQGNPLTHWLNEGKLSFYGKATPQRFYGLLRDLLSQLGMEPSRINTLIEEAVFEAQGWSNRAKTSGERLILAARRRAAVLYGGTLPTQLGIPGIPSQGPISGLRRWLEGIQEQSSQAILMQIKAFMSGGELPPPSDLEGMIAEVAAEWGVGNK